MPSNPDPTGFGVYVHWPFCAAKCPYCDFNSHVRHGGVDQRSYADAYRTEIRRTREAVGPRTVGSIFFGGGTPSLMEPATLEAILAEIAAAWSIDPDVEITLEANPSSVEAARFRAYRQAGVNRVSLGVQSLNDVDLRALGRLHDASEARRAIALAAGTFPRFSFDLIYARPHQTSAAWHAELSDALTLGANHLSLYQLTIEPGTPFAALYNKGRLTIPAPAAAHDLFEITRNLTTATGLPPYETSNHARPGEESRHNLLYWRYGEYAGIGPGAHGRLIIAGDRIATANEPGPETWRDLVMARGTGIVEREHLTPAHQADELLMMSLRLTEGLDLKRLARVGGVRPNPASITDLTTAGHLIYDPRTSRLKTTSSGSFLLNEIVLQVSSSLEPVVD